jgi:release factor glutamine methyltransferase
MQIPKLFIDSAARLLKPGGIFIMEHHEKQSDLVKQALKEEFTLPQTHADLTGRDRFTSARRR